MKSKPAPLAKITPPRLSEILHRTRLFKEFDGFRARSFIWVSGPPGSGKTTLVSSYLNFRKPKEIWYQVDPGDADPATLFYYLGLAARQATPRNRKPLPVLTPEYLPGLPVFSRRYVETLSQRFSRPFVIVFDNVQDVPDDSVFFQILKDGLTQLPERGTVILISRISPPAALAGLLANRQMAVLDWEALRFTEEETRGMIALHRRGKIPVEEIRRLHARTDGWAAGLVLMLDIHAKGKKDIKAIDESAGKAVFDYFAGEVFSQFPSGTQEILYQTAHLPQLTDQTAQKLTGSTRAKTILADLARSRFFVNEQVGQERAYEYHDLFREFLLERAKSDWAPAYLSQVRHRAAVVMERAGYPEDAVALYADSGDWAAMEKIILNQAPSLMAQGRFQTLDSWIGRLPESQVNEGAGLLFWAAMCCMPKNLAKARALLETAFDLSDEDKELSQIWRIICAIVDTYFYEFNDLEPLDRWITVMECLMDRHPEFGNSELEIQAVTGLVSALTWRYPGSPRLTPLAKRGFELLQKPVDHELRFRLAFALGILPSHTGDIGMIARIIEIMQPMIRPDSVNPITLMWWYLSNAVFGWYLNSRERCLDALANAERISLRHGLSVMDGEMNSQGVYLGLCLGDVKMAQEYLGKVAPFMQPHRALAYGHFRFQEACLALNQEGLESALQHGEASLAVGRSGRPIFGEALHRLVVAQALHGLGRMDGAANELARVKDLANTMGSHLLRYACLLVDAELAMDSGADDESLARLREAMRLGRDRGFLHFAWLRPSLVAGLCSRALEHGIEVDHVRNLIRRREAGMDPPSIETEAWPWKVKIYTLGRSSILLDDQALSAGKRKQHGKPLTMLIALIALGGREINQANLTEALWPEADGDTARRSFDTTLHRLRKLLGEEVLNLDMGKLTLNPRIVWVDLWAVERMLARLDDALSQPDPDAENVCTLADKVFARYAGPFLKEETDVAWALGRRERLHARVLAVLQNLGRCCERKEKWEVAVSYYSRGLDLDPLMEAFYQGLMVSYDRLGRRAEALSAYRRCRETLKVSLHVPPSPATEALYRKIEAAR